ncbi:MAG: hypothetical protein WB947_08010 [Thermoplasmata archaeon]
MPTLFVKCTACGAEFPTPIGEPEKGSSGVIISGLKLRCPVCHKEGAYDTADFHVPVVHDAPPEGGKAEAEENIKGEQKTKKKEPAVKLAGAVVVNPEARPPRGE